MNHTERKRNMTHQEWVEEVEWVLNEIKKGKPKVRACSWLMREAYYDDYSVVDAVAIALDSKQEFKMIRTGWMGLK